MKLRCALRSEMHQGLTHPEGAEAVILESLDKDHVLIEVRIPDSTYVGGATYDVLQAKREDLSDA